MLTTRDSYNAESAQAMAQDPTETRPIAPRVSSRSHFLIGLFLVCMCSLMLQIIETRILSAISWYYLAFFAISMAMFGMTGGSLFIYFRPSQFSAERLLEKLTWICIAFGLAVVVSALLLISTTVMEGGSRDLLMIGLLWSKLIVILAAPYFFVGMATSLALTRSPWPISLIYGVDLIGAATGCLVVLAVLTFMDAISSLFLVGAIGMLAGSFFSAAERATGHSRRPITGGTLWRIFAFPGLFAAAFAAFAVGNAAIQPYGLKLSLVKDTIEHALPDSFMWWNSFSRITVNQSLNGPPQMWGPSGAMPAVIIDARHMAIDGSAASAMYQFGGDLSKLTFLKYDITNLAYSIRHNGRAAIVGVGGGRDMLAAKMFGFGDVTGVELNPIFVKMLTSVLVGYNRLATLPGVQLIADEARSWFSRSTQRFDLIQMSMVDTWAATGAGAFSLSENGLYTVEGWRTFFDHLTPTGVFTVSRWYSPSNLNEAGPMISLAVVTLLREGVTNPREHLFLATTNHLATLIVSRAPLSGDDVNTLTTAADRLGFKILISPASPITAPALSKIVDSRTSEAASIAASRLSAMYHLDFTAPTDDRPFFFNQLRIGDPRSRSLALASSGGVLSGNLAAMGTLAIVILLSGGFVLLTIVVPSLPSLRQVSSRVAWVGTTYFFLIGLGFMMVEIGLVERISVFLGYPVYGLAIGLFGIIVSTGAGSFLSLQLPLLHRVRILLWAAILGFCLVLLPLWFPVLIANFASANLGLRAAVSLGAIIPTGILMGFGFPTGMQIVNEIDSRPTPWFWAVNGAAGVLGSGLAVAISIAFSISVTLWLGAVCYFLVGPVAFLLPQWRAIRRVGAAIAQ